MELIYSRCEPDTVLHQIHRIEEVENRTTQREDLVADNNFIQCSSLRMKSGIKFRPHRHIWKDRTRRVIAQESWVIIRGSVKFFFYDLDNTLLSTSILKAGDASFTLQGGHTYEILEDDTIVYEYKTGPYEGVELDKEFLTELYD